MVVVGGVTRLTDSGLSIVEWQPIVGTIPPLSQKDWDELFEKYHQTPQYKKVNRWHESGRIQGYFLVGIFSPPAGARHRAWHFLFPLFIFLPERRSTGRWALSWPEFFCWAACRERWGGIW